MLVLITYDVNTETLESRRRLRRISKICKNRGQRVQRSVFECLVDPDQWTIMKNKLLSVMNEKEDSLRFYYLGKNWQRRVEWVGMETSFDPEGPLVI